MPRGEVQVDGGLFQIVVAEQDLDGAKVGASLEQVSGEAVPQGVRMDTFLKAGPQGSMMAGVPDGFGIDGLISAMILLARE
jgi:hypothetical protein